MNINDYKGILVFAEQREGVLQNVGLELIGKARELAVDLDCAVTAVVLGHNIKDLSKDLVAYGADRVLVVDKEELKLYSTEAYTQALTAVVNAEKPEVVLFGASTLGRDLAPRVSSRCNTGLTADCTKLEISEDKQLWMTRPAFGGNLMATIVSPEHRPQMSTVRPGVMKKIAKDESRSGEVLDFNVHFDQAKIDKVKIVEVVKETGNTVDISEAKILVSGGRGVGHKANFELLEDLANEIGGVVSASRAQVDAGNMGHDRQVGQTGKTVRPEVYFACGISGAIQHVAGMEESEYIIAINKDRFAPIFSVADLGIVGDLTKILPILTEEIKKYKATK